MDTPTPTSDNLTFQSAAAFPAPPLEHGPQQGWATAAGPVPGLGPEQSVSSVCVYCVDCFAQLMNM